MNGLFEKARQNYGNMHSYSNKIVKNECLLSFEIIRKLN